MLLSDTRFLWSNEYEKSYSFIDLRGRGRDANVKRPTGIAKPVDGNATIIES